MPGRRKGTKGQALRRRPSAPAGDGDVGFRLLLDQVPALCWTTDADLRFTSLVGEVACRAIGVRASEVIGKTLFEYLGTRDAECLPIAAHRRALAGEAADYERTLPGGRIIRAHVEPLRSAGGAVIGTVGVVIDITNQKRAEQALDLERRQLLSIFDSVDQIVYVADPETYEVLYQNKALRDDRGDVVGRKCYEAFQGRPSPCPFCTNDRIFGENLGQSCVWEFQNEVNGRWYRCIDRAIRWPDGRMVRHEMAIDITDAKRTEQALRQSEQRYRDLFEQSILGIYRTTPDGRILMANPALVRMLGFDSFEELARRNLEKEGLDPPGARAEFKKRLEADLQVVGWESAWLRRDGTRLLVRENARAVRVERGRVLCYEGTVEDITEYKQAEAALREYAERVQALREMDTAILAAGSPEAIASAALEHLRRLVPCARASVVEFDRRQQVVEVLAAHADGPTALGTGARFALSEFALEEGLERGETSVVADIARVPHTAATVRALYEEGIRSYVSVPLIYEGELIGALNLGAAEPGAFTPEHIDVAREVAAPMAIAIQRRRAEEERRQWEVGLQRAQKLESLGLMAGGVAHDFNNLLVSILGSATLAFTDLPPGPSPVRTCLERVEKAATRAAELTNQLLAYSGKGAFVRQPVDLGAVVAEMMELLKVSIPRKVTLVPELAADLPAVEADATQLRQVAMNLITNAADAVGDAAGTITVRTGVLEADAACLAETHLGRTLTPGRYVYLRVADTGCGMTPETQAKIFDPFFSTKFPGRGLGLPVVFGIVRSHGGAIRVSSEAGRGSAFTILLPPSERPVAAVAPKDEQRARPAAGSVLVVDDEEFVRQTARMTLERFGFTVLLAASGRQAVEILQATPDGIDAVLLDMTMPDMRGDEVFAAIRRLRPDAPVVLTSGYDEYETTSHFAGAGLAGFIQKPYTAAALVEKIRQVIPS